MGLLIYRLEYPLLTKSQTQIKRSNVLNNRNDNQISQEKHLQSIYRRTRTQCKLIKMPSKPRISLWFGESNAKDIKNDSVNEKQYGNSSFLYYKPRKSDLSLVNNSSQYLSTSYKKSGHATNKKISFGELNQNKQFSRSKKRIIIKTTPQPRHSINDQKQTEADTSFDKVVSYSNMNSITNNNNNYKNKTDLLSDINRPKSYIKRQKLSNIPEDNNSTILKKSKNRLTNHFILPQKNNVFKLFLRNKNSTDPKDKKSYCINSSSNNDSFSSGDQVSLIRNSNIGSYDEYNCSSESIILQKAKTSKTIDHIFIQCESKESDLCSKYSPNHNKNTKKIHLHKQKLHALTKLMSKDHLIKIDFNLNKHKQDKIKDVYQFIETKVGCLLNEPPSQRESDNSIMSFEQRYTSLNKSRISFINSLALNINKALLYPFMKNTYHSSITNIIVSPFIKKILNEKYDSQIYYRMLETYLGYDHKFNTLRNDNIDLKDYKYFKNKYLELDFNQFNTFGQNTMKIKKRKLYDTMVSKFNPFFKKLWPYSSSLSLNAKKQKQRKKSDVDKTLLQDNFFSREDFDVNKLEEMTRKLELVPRCKVKNIKFRMIDEQEEIKKNKNMSKESLVFRTQEIKLKIKDKLETIEEILFFLIQEVNFKEFKKLLEQFQMSLESRDKEGNTYLIFAVECLFVECVVYLIRKGSNLNAQNNFEIADLLIKHGADETIMNKNHLTPWQCLSLDKK